MSPARRIGHVYWLRCGAHALDDYFARHAWTNDAAGIGRTYVYARADDEVPALPLVLGFYSLSMASAPPATLEPLTQRRLPRYPVPVALIGRLAVDLRARGRRVGEALLMDCPTFLLTIYAKSAKDNMSRAEIAELKTLVDILKTESMEKFHG